MSTLPEGVSLNVVKRINNISEIKTKNETSEDSSAPYIWTTPINPNAITTGFFILAGLSCIILFYFIFRAIRLRRRNYKVRRYGVIASREDVEMTPLENEDDDEDSTVFDISVKTHTRS